MLLENQAHCHFFRNTEILFIYLFVCLFIYIEVQLRYNILVSDVQCNNSILVYIVK